MKKQINDLLLKMQIGENCIGETANALLNLYSVSNCADLKHELEVTDKEIYERFMLWMGMKPSKAKQVEENKVIRYDDIDNCDVRFTKTGYDEFYAGAVFDVNGKIVKAYIDSHVAYASDNCKEIDKMLED